MEIAIIWAVVGAGVCWYVAGQKGRNQVTWALLGALLGVFAIIAVFIVSDQSKQPAGATTAATATAAGPTVADNPATVSPGGPSVEAPIAAGAPVNEDRMPCPNCGESIARAAKACRFCGHDLSAATT